MAWADYMYTGSRDALEAQYPKIVDYLLMQQERSSDGAFTSIKPGDTMGDPSDIIDWPRGERDNYEMSNSNAISTVPNAFHYYAVRITARIAALLGHTGDAADFNARADRIQALFAGPTFWDGSKYRDGENAEHSSAHANFFPMAFGLVPADRVDSVMAFLKTTRTINGRTEYMPCSVYGAQYFLEALFEGGEAEHAIFLMTDDSESRKRHWYNMIREGATITTEAWGMEFKPNQDWNHAWGAAPGNIIPRYLLGVRPLEPGFEKALIQPQPGELKNVRGAVPTIRGPVTVAIKQLKGQCVLVVDIPANMTAKVGVPRISVSSTKVLLDGRAVAAESDGDFFYVANVGSGRHTIVLQ
jgi:hypothetical protein